MTHFTCSFFYGRINKCLDIKVKIYLVIRCAMARIMFVIFQSLTKKSHKFTLYVPNNERALQWIIRTSFMNGHVVEHLLYVFAARRKNRKEITICIKSRHYFRDKTQRERTCFNYIPRIWHTLENINLSINRLILWTAR